MVGVANIAPNKLRAAACLGATPVKAFFHVTLPATLPFILTGMRLAMGNSFATVVAAEMIAADGLHQTDKSYHCLGVAAARVVAGGIGRAVVTDVIVAVHE